MSLMANIECAIIGAALEHDLAAWSLRSKIWLITVVYAIDGGRVDHCQALLCYVGEGQKRGRAGKNYCASKNHRGDGRWPTLTLQNHGLY